jgi:hypothetical protein
MHSTLDPRVLGYVETKQGEKTVRGWAFHHHGETILQVLSSGKVVVPKMEERKDVVDFYAGRLPKKAPLYCGWSFDREDGYELQMKIDTTWVTIFKENQLVATVTETLPSFIVVDNFYTDPDSVRAFALQQPLSLHPNNHKGIRSDAVYRFPGLKERFEQLLGTPIQGWETYGTNGCFQINLAGEQAVYHADGQTYAGVLFLTPNAPGAAGTKFYRSKSGVRKPTPANHDEVFQGGFYDSTRFEKLDVVGNVYNRLVLFDAKLIHAADTYFGKTRDDGRLIQLFFFDV